MKFLSVFAILCLALSCNQVNSAALNGPVETAEKLFKELQVTIDAAVNSATGTFNTIYNEIAQKAIWLQRDTEQALVDAAKLWNDQIDKATAEANKAGVDVTECVGTSQKVISELPKELLANVTSCIEDNLSGATAIIDDLIGDIKDTVNDVVINIGDQIETCKEESFLSQAVCLGKVTVSITTEAVKLPLKIAKDVADGKSYVDSVVSSLPTLCGAQSAVSLANDAGAIVKDVTLCLAEKVSPSPASSPSSPAV